MFWSDAVTVNVPQDHFLVFEWTVEYTQIPATIVASTYFTSEIREGATRPSFCSSAPLPDLIGCDRNKVRLSFIGDSITEGTGSPAYTYEFWVSQIADRLGTGYSVWNLGLDSGRANDVIRGTSWKEKLKNTDILSICIGINDVMSIYGGKPQTGASASAAEIVSWITKIAAMAEEAGAEIIIFSVPPFNLTGANLTKWQTVNSDLKKLADKKGYDFFDFAAVLGDPENPAKCLYGDHPNGAGCKAVADAFMAAGILEPKD
jgi:lysophospholipase L1-like esterase